MVKLKKLGIIFIMFFVIIMMSACNDKDDPLYINAMSFFFDNNGGNIIIKNKKQDVYFENPDETFYSGVSFSIIEKKNGEDKENIYSYNYNEGTGIGSYFKKGSSVKLITTKKSYSYRIWRYSSLQYGVYFYEDDKQYTNYNVIDKELLPDYFARVSTSSDFEGKLKMEKGESIGLFCDAIAPIYDTRPIINGEVGYKSLNPDITINTISNSNPYSNDGLRSIITYINITYNGDDGELDLSEIAFEQVPIE